MESTFQNRHDVTEVSTREVLQIIWQGRWIVLSVTLVFSIAGATVGWLAPEYYKATTVLSPVSNTSSSGQLSGLSSLASQFGGLASLAGISVGGDSKKSESIAVLQSETLTERYIREHDLLPVLYEEKWDRESGRWKNPDSKAVPTLWRANQYFKKKVRNVVSDTKTGLVTLEITWKDPIAAAAWANGLVRMTNEYLRDKAIAESEKNIAYLTDQAARTDIIGARQAIFTILQNEINKAMLARGSDEYALKVLDPAVAPEKPSSLPWYIWTVIGTLCGLFCAVPVVLLRRAFTQSRVDKR